MNIWDKDDFMQHNDVDVDFNKGLENLSVTDFPNDEDVVGGSYYSIEASVSISEEGSIPRRPCGVSHGSNIKMRLR